MVKNILIFFNCFLFENNFYYDVAEFDQLGFQDGASNSSENLALFHDSIMFYLVVVLILVGWLLASSLINKNFNKFLSENSFIEIIWTSIPAIILILIAIPSLYLLYNIDENIDPSLTIKVIGHQWYWTYELPNFPSEVEFDSYMIPTLDLVKGEFRLLEVDNKLYLPINTNIRLIISSTDVIHSWTVPSLGVKADAVPGRLNQVNFIINRPGKFFGQCSEICGSNHSFMPISILSVSFEKFINWISSIEE